MDTPGSTSTVRQLKQLLTQRAVSRRRFAGVSAGTIAAAMLGGTSPIGAGRTVLAQDGGKEFHAAYPYEEPPNGHFNSFASTGNILQGPSTVYGDLIIQPLAMFYWESQTWEPLLAVDWGFVASADAATPAAESSPVASPAASGSAQPLDGVSAIAGQAAAVAPANADTFVVKLREGVVWEDGTPFTAKDVVDTLWCMRIMSDVVWQYIDHVEAVDDLTVQAHMAVPATVVERYIVRRSNPRPSAIYGEWAQKARDLWASGTADDAASKQLLDDFNKFRPDKVIASGPFTIDIPSITGSQMTLVKNPTAWNVDKVAFDRIINYNGETDTITPVVLAKEVDYATHGFPPATEQEMMASGIRVLRPPTYGGGAAYINIGKLGDIFGDKRVRQGLMHMINREQNGFIALAESGVANKYVAGFSDILVPNWISEADLATLNTYPLDLEKAAALLTEAGWKKEGDVWMTPLGEKASFEYIHPAEYADSSASAQDFCEQMTTQGIEMIPRGVTFTQQPIDMDKGNFELAQSGWGSSSNPHPHFAFVVPFFTRNYPIARNNGGRGIDFPLEQETDVAGKVNIEQLVVECARGLDVEQQKAQVTTVAQVFNELLPCIPFYERYGNNAALEGVRVVAWPPEGDPMLKQAPYADGIPTLLMYTGRIEGV